jgi:hypothetical protein
MASTRTRSHWARHGGEVDDGLLRCRADDRVRVEQERGEETAERRGSGGAGQSGDRAASEELVVAQGLRGGDERFARDADGGGACLRGKDGEEARGGDGRVLAVATGLRGDHLDEFGCEGLGLGAVLIGGWEGGDDGGEAGSAIEPPEEGAAAWQVAWDEPEFMPDMG